MITRPEKTLFVNEEVLTHYGLSNQVKYNVRPGVRWPAEIASSNSNKAWMSVIVLITRPENSLCINEETLSHKWLSHQIKYNFVIITPPEEVLTYWGLSHQIKYNVVQRGRSPAEIACSNSNEV